MLQPSGTINHKIIDIITTFCLPSVSPLCVKTLLTYVTVKIPQHVRYHKLYNIHIKEKQFTNIVLEFQRCCLSLSLIPCLLNHLFIQSNNPLMSVTGATCNGLIKSRCEKASGHCRGEVSAHKIANQILTGCLSHWHSEC